MTRTSHATDTLTFKSMQLSVLALYRFVSQLRLMGVAVS